MPLSTQVENQPSKLNDLLDIVKTNETSIEMSNGKISDEAKELLARLYNECLDTHENSHNVDEGDRTFIGFTSVYLPLVEFHLVYL